MLFRKGLFAFIGILLCTCLVSANAFVVKKEPLDAEKAFVFSYSINSSNQVTTQWDIAPGYYLYVKRMHYSVSPAAKIDVIYPKGEWKTDKNTKKQYEIYMGTTTIPINLNSPNQNVQLNIDYQGCSDSGFCYPPMHKNINLTLMTQQVASDSDTHLTSLVTDQNGVNQLLKTEHFGMMMLLFIGLGLLLAFTPCVLPMIPILTGIIVGQKQPVSSKKAFVLSLIYVLATACTYAVAGLVVASMGGAVQVWLQKTWFIAATSGLFVLLAFSLFGFYELRLPRSMQNKLTTLSNQQQGGTFVGVFFMGVLSTLIVSPCVTAPLVGVLMYISQTGNMLLGASALFAIGIGMGIPLLLIGTTAGKWLPKSGPWMEAVKKSFGILMLGMAVWLLARVVSPTVTIMFWGVLLLVVALFLTTYVGQFIKLRKFVRGLGLVVGCSGMLLIFGGMGMPNPMMKWVSGAYQTSADQRFVVVRDIADFNKQLLIAQAAHQPVILDFYADWCESCISMDHHVFDVPDVQQRLNDYVLLRADLSANSAADQDLLKYFNVVAPPTVLFFDAKGQEINSQRIVGEVDAKEFLVRLNRL